jgi:hypothetical protein
MNLLLVVNTFYFIQFYAGAVLKQTSLIEPISTISANQIVVYLVIEATSQISSKFHQTLWGNRFFDNLVDVE